MSFLAIAPLGFQQLTGMSSAVGLTPPAGANLAICRAAVQTVMWRDDGTAPNAAIGMPILVTDLPFEYTGNLKAIQFIQMTSGAILNVSYYRISG